MEIEFEVSRTVVITREESGVITLDVPSNVPEGDREEWVMKQLTDGELTMDDSAWEISDETEEADYTQVDLMNEY